MVGYEKRFRDTCMALSWTFLLTCTIACSSVSEKNSNPNVDPYSRAAKDYVDLKFLSCLSELDTLPKSTSQSKKVTDLRDYCYQGVEAYLRLELMLQGEPAPPADRRSPASLHALKLEIGSGNKSIEPCTREKSLDDVTRMDHPFFAMNVPGGWRLQQKWCQGADRPLESFTLSNPFGSSVEISRYKIPADQPSYNVINFLNRRQLISARVVTIKSRKWLTWNDPIGRGYMAIQGSDLWRIVTRDQPIMIDQVRNDRDEILNSIKIRNLSNRGKWHRRPASLTSEHFSSCTLFSNFAEGAPCAVQGQMCKTLTIAGFLGSPNPAGTYRCD